MTHPPVIVVDEYDHETGVAMLAEVWEKGLHHRIVHILVEDSDGRLLLQKRAPNMLLWPNLWDHSAGGHVDQGSSYEQSARLEVAEELGLHDVKLEEIATYQTHGSYDGRRLNRFNKLYRVQVPTGTEIHAEQEELSEARWFTRAEVKQLIKDHPDQLTDGVRQSIESYYL